MVCLSLGELLANKVEVLDVSAAPKVDTMAELNVAPGLPEKGRSKIQITIIGAQGLANADFGGASDAYCVCKVLGRRRSPLAARRPPPSTAATCC